MKTGVLIHGYHPNANGWSDVMWGVAPERHGRVTRGILTARQFNADIVQVGAGRFEGFDPPWLDADHFLADCERLRDFGLGPEQVADVVSWLKPRLVLRAEAGNTSFELKRATDLFESRGIERMIIVSSPTHIPRCLRDAMVVLDQRFSPLRANLMAVSSDTSYPDFGPEDVAIVEPPHQAHHEEEIAPLRDHVTRLLELSPDARSAVLADLSLVLDSRDQDDPAVIRTRDRDRSDAGRLARDRRVHAEGRFYHSRERASRSSGAPSP